MEQLLNKAGDVFVSQFMRLGTSAKLLEIAGPLDKASDALLASNSKDTAQDEPDSGHMKETGRVSEASKKLDAETSTKEPELESRSATNEPESVCKEPSNSMEPELESLPDSKTKSKKEESESGSKEPNLESDKHLNLATSEEGHREPPLEHSDQKHELVCASAKDSEALTLEPNQQPPDVVSSSKVEAESALEEASDSSKKADSEPNKDLSKEPVRSFVSCKIDIDTCYINCSMQQHLQPHPLSSLPCKSTMPTSGKIGTWSDPSIASTYGMNFQFWNWQMKAMDGSGLSSMIDWRRCIPAAVQKLIPILLRVGVSFVTKF